MSVFFFIDQKRVELEYLSGFVTSPGKTVEIYQDVTNPDLFYVCDNEKFTHTELKATELIGYLSFRLHKVHYLLNRKEEK